MRISLYVKGGQYFITGLLKLSVRGSMQQAQRRMKGFLRQPIHCFGGMLKPVTPSSHAAYCCPGSETAQITTVGLIHAPVYLDTTEVTG